MHLNRNIIIMTDCHIMCVCVCARPSVTPGFAEGSLGRKACLQSDRFETSSGDMPEQLTSWFGLLVNA